MEVTKHIKFNLEPLENKNVFKVMDLVKHILESKKYYYWFSAGTVLGLYREDKGYISWDTDIDFEMIGDNLDFNTFISDMLKLGLVRARTIINECNFIQLAFMYQPENIIVDFYFYYSNPENKEVYISKTDAGNLLLPKNLIENLELIKGYKVPSPVEDYLTFRYGDWKQPKLKKGGWANLAGEALQ